MQSIKSLQDLQEHQLAFLREATHPVHLVVEGAQSQLGRVLAAFAERVQALCPHVSYSTAPSEAEQQPRLGLQPCGGRVPLWFYALPTGAKLAGFAHAMRVMSSPPQLPEPFCTQVDRIPAEARLAVTLVTEEHCQLCPSAIHAVTVLAQAHPGVSVSIQDSTQSQELLAKHSVSKVPALFVNGTLLHVGAFQLADLLAQLNRRTLLEEIGRAQSEGPFDVIVTRADTDGLKEADSALAAGHSVALAFKALAPGDSVDMAQLLRPFEVLTDEYRALAGLRARGARVLHGIGVQGSTASQQPGTPSTITLQNGAVLQAQRLVLPPQAKLKRLGVPGESDYEGFGVVSGQSFDPQMARGADIVVIGGSRLGATVAAQLSRLAKSVTLLEMSYRLWVSDRRERELRALGNVRVVLNAKVTAFEGDGQSLTGVTFEDTVLGEPSTIKAALAFVRLGFQKEVVSSEEDCPDCKLPVKPLEDCAS